MEWKLSGLTLVQAGLSACCHFNRGPLSLSLSILANPGCADSVGRELEENDWPDAIAVELL